MYLILQGVLSPADPGVLESVAERRAVLFQQVEDWRDYEVLTAVQDCGLLGRSGWLITDEGILTAQVVDCSQAAHSMNGIMADVSEGEIGRGWLVLKNNE